MSGRVKIEETLRVGEEQLVCSKCGSVVDEYKAMHCTRCGYDFLTDEMPTQTGTEDKAGMDEESDSTSSGSLLRQPISTWKVAVAAVVILALLFGRYHVVQGAGVLGVTVVPKVHTWSETFVSLDAITGMPYITAKSKYPLAVQALQREGIIETDEEFEDRTRREFEQDIERERQRWMP